MRTINEFFTLINGEKIPAVGLGTWQINDGEDAYNACMYALNEGYRHIDTAAAYGNEQSVGKAIQDSKINRKDIYITTKLPAEIKTYDGAVKYFNDSLKKLNVDYIDLYLIHAPWPWDKVGMDCKAGIIEVWKAFEEFYKAGKVKAIGVSNFNVDDLNSLMANCNINPMVNQIRYFIGNTQDETVKFCNSHNILIQAYSPIATGRLLNNEVIRKIAEKYDKTLPQLCIRFCYQNNTLPLPKSSKKEHIISNADIDFIISDEDMKYLNSLKNIL